jgi:hypothetical protein
MQTPKPFTVSRDSVTIFIVYAYSAQHARAIVAARLSDTAGITIAAVKGARR